VPFLFVANLNSDDEKDQIVRMMYFAVLIAMIAVAAPTMSQSATAKSSTIANQNQAILEFFDSVDQAELARSPTSKTVRGIKDADYGKWDDASDAAEMRAFKADMTALKIMHQRFNPAQLNANTLLSYRLFEKRAARRAAAFEYRGNGYVFDQMNGPQSELPAFLINLHRIDTKSDAEAYISRLAGLGVVLDQYIVEARGAAQKQIMPPKWLFPYVISDTRNVISGAPFDSGADAPLYADLKSKLAKLDISASEKDRLLKAGADALKASIKPAYERLITEMIRQQALAGTDDGVWRFKNGAAYYSERLNNYTTTNLTPDDIHALGLTQVARIHGEMRDIMRQVKFAGDLPAFFKFMREDPQFTAPNTDAGRATYLAETEKAKQAITALLPKWFGILPQAAMVVKRVEEFREKSAGKAFYQRPSPDGKRPGTYYANLYDMANMPLTEVEALFYHEGLPGHHLQLAIQTELKDVPNFRKFGGITAYSEGWGLYSEKLAKDMGLYTDPYRDFGRLQLELHRAIRLVVDSGLHHKRWSREQAIRYVENNSADAPGGIVKAIERYIVYPGQATAYMVGRLKISSLRDKAQQALGKEFDVRSFHDVILSSGPLPLDILEEQVDAWVKDMRIKQK
jgi:uncharacterized protein (DUF885 family)